MILSFCFISSSLIGLLQPLMLVSHRVTLTFDHSGPIFEQYPSLYPIRFYVVAGKTTQAVQESGGQHPKEPRTRGGFVDSHGVHSAHPQGVPLWLSPNR
jgi:hypothetical protein